MSAEDVGWSGDQLVIGKHSGVHAIEDVLKKRGYRLDRDQLRQVSERVKEAADRDKVVEEEDVVAFAGEVLDELAPDEKILELKEVSVMTGNGFTPSATIKLTIDGEEVVGTATESDRSTPRPTPSDRSCGRASMTRSSSESTASRPSRAERTLSLTRTFNSKTARATGTAAKRSTRTSSWRQSTRWSKARTARSSLGASPATLPSPTTRRRRPRRPRPRVPILDDEIGRCGDEHEEFVAALAAFASLAAIAALTAETRSTRQPRNEITHE